MHPEDFRRHGHAWWTGWPTISARVGELPVTPAGRPGRHPPATPGLTSRSRRAVRSALPGLPGPDRPRDDALEPSRMVRLLPRQQQPAVGPGRDADRPRGAVHVVGTSPAATELEQVVMDWLRQMVGLAGGVRRRHSGHGLHRHAGGAAHRARARDRGRRRAPGAERRPRRSRSYASRGGALLGGQRRQARGLRARAAAQDRDRRGLRDASRGPGARDRTTISGGMRPACVVASIGTTSSTAIDPVARDRGDLPPHGDLAPRGRRLRRLGRDRARAALDLRRGGPGGQRRAQPAQVAADQLRLHRLLRARPDALLSAFSPAPEYLRTAHDDAGGELSATGASSWAGGSGRSSSGS